MPNMILSHLLLNSYTFDTDTVITGLSLDSRTIQPGELFLACSGTVSNGRDYIDVAVQKGANAVLVEGKENEINLKNKIPIISIPDLKFKIGELASRFYSDSSKKLKIIGVTGTNGKTSCTHFLAAALKHLHQKCGIIGTLGFGFYEEMVPGSLTTPDPITLHRIFYELVQQDAKWVAMEVSSHSLDQGRVAGIEFEVGVFTNLTRDHLDYHGSMENYGATKKKLFDSALSKQAVINASDPYGMTWLNSLAREKLFAYALSNESNVKQALTYAKNVLFNTQGIQADVVSQWGEGRLSVPLMGDFNLSNLLAVLTTLCSIGIPFEEGLESLKKVSPVAGRMQSLGGQNKPLVIVDYAHTPDAIEKVLMTLKKQCHGKLHCLFGCGGDRDPGKRPLMASVAERYADVVMVTNDNPRHEDPKKIIEDILKGFSHLNKVTVQEDRARAIHEIIMNAEIEDYVLIAGKGAELFQQIGEQRIPFNDVEQAQAVLNQWQGK